MASKNSLYSYFFSNSAPQDLYPSITEDPKPSATSSSTSSLYPPVDMANNPYIVVDDEKNDNLPPPVEETLIAVPGAILHLIDKQSSVELASGDFRVVLLRQGEGSIAAIARVGDEVQWPLARDAAAVRLDESHYFFSLRVPVAGTAGSIIYADEPSGDGEVISYGLTFASKGQQQTLKQLDNILDNYCSFSVQEVKTKVVDGSVPKEVAPAEVMKGGSKKATMEERSAAYWTTLAPNVEDYNSKVAKSIAKGSGQLVKGILWCGDVTADRLRWGNDFLKRRMGAKGKPTEISPEAMRRIQRVKRMTKMSEKVANGILSGVVKVSGYFTSTVVNSAVGRKFFRLLPGEVLLASLDGFGTICDAVEIAGKNVMSTTTVATTGLVSHRYGEQAGEMTNQSLSAAGHAFGTAWTVFKIRKALNPKSSFKPTTLAKQSLKQAAAELKGKKQGTVA